MAIAGEVRFISTSMGLPLLEELVNEFLKEQEAAGKIWRAVGIVATGSGVVSVMLQLDVEFVTTMEVVMNAGEVTPLPTIMPGAPA